MQSNSSSDYNIGDYYNSRIATAIMLTLFSVIGVPGNLLVVIVKWKEKKMNNTNFLIFIMAFVDFIGALDAFLNFLTLTVFFQNNIDIKFCKIVIMLNYSSNTPAIYLIFGVSIIRYYHICKPHMMHSIYKNIPFLCAFVIILTLSIAVIYAICSDSLQWPDEIPGTYCEVYKKHNCRLAYNLSLMIIILSYIFCLTGLIGLNFRILKRMYQH